MEKHTENQGQYEVEMGLKGYAVYLREDSA